MKNKYYRFLSVGLVFAAALMFFAACEQMAGSTTVIVDPKPPTVIDTQNPVIPGTPGLASSNIWVQKVDNLSPDFAMGVDISSVLAGEAAGVTYRDEQGAVKDIFDILADAGVNYIRVRVWVDPHVRQWDKDNKATQGGFWQITQGKGKDGPYALTDPDDWEIGAGYGAGNADAENARKIGGRIVASNARTGKNLKMLVNFHYSDFWGDPGTQIRPKAWRGLSIPLIAARLREYTLESLVSIASSGVTIGAVQTGNEINGGIAGTGGGSADMFTLLKAGIQGVRNFNARHGQNAKVVVHYTDPQNGFGSRISALDANNIDYDVFGSSYYPRWHGTIPQLQAAIQGILQAKPGKEVWVVEHGVSAFPSGTNGNVTDARLAVGVQYPETIQGQANAIRDVIAAASVSGGMGYFIYEAAWVDPGTLTTMSQAEYEESGYGIAAGYSSVFRPNGDSRPSPDTFNALFATALVPEGDNQVRGNFAESTKTWYDGVSGDAIRKSYGNLVPGQAYPSLKVFKYAYTGAEDTTSRGDYVMYVPSPPQANLTKGDIGSIATKLPSGVAAQWASGNTTNISVQWNGDDIAAITEASSAPYTVNGTASSSGGSTWPVVISVMVPPGVNLVQNPGFEDEDMSAWTIPGSGYRRNGDFHDGAYSFDHSSGASIYQTINITETGTYNLSVYHEGAGNITLFIRTSGGSDLVSDTFANGGWMAYRSDSVSCNLNAGDTVEIGIESNNWGCVDDFYLWKD
ncbi:MAG: glycosyl hydrolase 53 family protein [Treponema sp.]|jgi:arabinogalactan endo-1,4-beta-galactosidase|nr:glycosyl hydrolase 53 family protein [Treponema sp.]